MKTKSRHSVHLVAHICIITSSSAQLSRSNSVSITNEIYDTLFSSFLSSFTSSSSQWASSSSSSLLLFCAFCLLKKHFYIFATIQILAVVLHWFNAIHAPIQTNRDNKVMHTMRQLSKIHMRRTFESYVWINISVHTTHRIYLYRTRLDNNNCTHQQKKTKCDRFCCHCECSERERMILIFVVLFLEVRRWSRSCDKLQETAAWTKAQRQKKWNEMKMHEKNATSKQKHTHAW